jgi:hypothetical protein
MWIFLINAQSTSIIWSYALFTCRNSTDHVEWPQVLQKWHSRQVGWIRESHSEVVLTKSRPVSTKHSTTAHLYKNLEVSELQEFSSVKSLDAFFGPVLRWIRGKGLELWEIQVSLNNTFTYCTIRIWRLLIFKNLQICECFWDQDLRWIWVPMKLKEVDSRVTGGGTMEIW